ncbi:MAG: 3'-5' exonuclease domain-containing protein 2 [Bacteroidales bacterium]|nr:3'-5' exonuclease domain-containing protein 2 [Bacteroidales bacterium]
MENIRRNRSFLNNISKDDIKNLPLQQFPGRILLIDDDSQLGFLNHKLANKRLLGFDTETRPSFRKGKKHKVSLLQLATADEAYLIRLNRVGLPEPVITLFENANIKKIGLAIRDDINSLMQLNPFQPEGFIDLQQYVKRFDILDNGLRKLAANILGFRISKKQQTSNWEKEVLEDEQLIYAATDSWICYQIYVTLEKQAL